jgi:hypothetical protein
MYHALLARYMFCTRGQNLSGDDVQGVEENGKWYRPARVHRCNVHVTGAVQICIHCYVYASLI